MVKTIKKIQPLSAEFKSALHISLPTFFAYFPLGIVFGVIFSQTQYPWVLAPIMSALVYAGSVQFVLLSMLHSHSSFTAILIASAFIAFRNSFYGLNLLERYQVSWPLKLFLSFTLVDATYVNVLSHPAKPGYNDKKFCFHLSWLAYAYWVGGSFLGALGSNFIPVFPEMVFILPCFFFVLVIEYFLAKRKKQTIITPILLAVFAYLIAPNQYLLLAIIFSVIAILASDYFVRRAKHA